MHGFEPRHPDPRLFVAFLRLDALVPGERLIRLARLGAIAVMRLVVQHDDLLPAGQFTAYTPDHLIGRFHERVGLALGQYGLGEFRCLSAFALDEAVVIGDDDGGLAEPLQQIGRQQIAFAVVVRRIGRQQHTQAIANRDPGRDDEEGIAEAAVLPVLELVERLPRDQHGHDNGLPGSGCHLEGHARKAGVEAGVLVAQLVFDPGVAVVAGDLGEIDRRFERFDLAEEQFPLAIRVAPVAQEPTAHT
jgi:hypothetical protein